VLVQRVYPNRSRERSHRGCPARGADPEGPTTVSWNIVGPTVSHRHVGVGVPIYGLCAVVILDQDGLLRVASIAIDELANEGPTWILIGC